MPFKMRGSADNLLTHHPTEATTNFFINGPDQPTVRSTDCLRPAHYSEALSVRRVGFIVQWCAGGGTVQ